ncbi:hypothetical protein SPHS6_02013 [Sphingobium sp. S6]|nr:hypothetical protein SPHS6_02013 [Sphingobium sp. S6]CAD7338629.1 hypothetical protein SPHS8_02099 [Sphingobium sp. S8]
MAPLTAIPPLFVIPATRRAALANAGISCLTTGPIQPEMPAFAGMTGKK